MSDPHDPWKLPDDPNAPKPGEIPEGEQLEDEAFDLLADDDPSGDVFIDLSDEDPVAEAAVVDDGTPPLEAQAVPANLDEPQALELEPEFDLGEDLELLDESEGQGSEAGEGAVGFDLPTMPTEEGAMTRGVSRDELDFLMDEIPQAESASFVGTPAEDVPQAQAEEPVAQDMTDIGESVPVAESASGVLLDAEPVSFAGLPEGTVADLGESVPDAESASSPVLEAEAIEPGEAAITESALWAEAADLGDAVPEAESASSPVLEAEAIEPEPAAAEPYEPTVPESELWAEAAAGSVPDFKLPDDIDPLRPASAWYHTPAAPPVPAPEAGNPPPVAAQAADEGNIFGGPLPRTHEGSDIFGWKAPAAADASHIFGEHAGVPAAEPVEGPKSTPSAQIRETSANPYADDIDTGATPRASDEASSILDELVGSKPSFTIDGSEVRLEDPGIEATLSNDEKLPEFDLEPGLPSFTHADDPAIELLADDATPAAGGSEVPVDGHHSAIDPSKEWFASPGSDLFAERNTPASGNEPRVDPLAADLDMDPPSFSATASSIFTGQKPPEPVTGGSASVRIGNNDEEQTVFDQLGDEDGASQILRAKPPTAPQAPKSTDSTQEDEADIDWLAADASSVENAYDDLRDAPASGIFSKTHLPPTEGPPSSIFSKSNLDPAARRREEDSTHKMDSAGNIVADLFGEPSSKSLNTDDVKGQSPPSTASEVEVDWLASTDEPEPIHEPVAAFDMVEDSGPAPVAAIVEDEDETDERPTPRRPAREKASSGGGGGLLIGGLAGLVGGIAVSAGVFFSGILGGSSDKETPPVQIAKLDPKKEAETAARIKSLEVARAEAEQKLTDAIEKEKTYSQDLARIQEDKNTFEITAKIAEDKVKELEKTVATAKADQTKAETSAKDALAKIADLEKAATEATATAKKATEDLAVATKMLDDVKDAKTKIETLTTDLAKANQTIGVITKELQDGKLLPADAADPAAVAAAVKSAIGKATSMPGNPPAGAGLTAAELQELKDRVTKSEAAAKAATEKLAADTTALKTDYQAQIDTLKKTHEAEVKKLTAGSPDLAKLREETAAAIKKAQDTAATEVAKAKEAATAEAKKAADALAEVKKAQDDAVAMKALSDKLAADMAKLKEDYDGKLAAAQKKATEDLAKAEAELTAAKADLAGVMTPSQALDLWLPLLAEARRPTDADGAIATANKVLAAATPGTEGYAKAQAVKGLAELIKGNDAGARTAFALAKKDPSFAGKPWAKVVDEGTQSLTDPLAKFRKPVDPERKDPRAAVRLLDEGIRLYVNRRYVEAEKSLSLAVAHDSASPVAWYYLGAARWQNGQRDAARQDFRQGAEREMLRTMASATVEQAIAAIQGPVRAAIADVRP